MNEDSRVDPPVQTLVHLIIHPSSIPLSIHPSTSRAGHTARRLTWCRQLGSEGKLWTWGSPSRQLRKQCSAACDSPCCWSRPPSSKRPSLPPLSMASPPWRRPGRAGNAAAPTGDKLQGVPEKTAREMGTERAGLSRPSRAGSGNAAVRKRQLHPPLCTAEPACRQDGVACRLTGIWANRCTRHWLRRRPPEPSHV